MVSQYSCFTLNPFFIGGGSTLPHAAWFQVTACNPSWAGWKTMGGSAGLPCSASKVTPDLTARINPMAKQGYGTVTWIFCNRCAAIRTQT